MSINNQTEIIHLLNQPKVPESPASSVKNISSPVIEVKLADRLDTILTGLVSKQLSVHTRRAYGLDAQQFVAWLTSYNMNITALSKSDIEQYRRYLSDKFARPSAARKLAVVRKLLDEAVERGLLAFNPALSVDGFKQEQETPHNALEKKDARQLLEAVDTSTRQGKRDYAIISLLLRTGLRRSECAALVLGDLQHEGGHNIVVIRHGKGDKRRKVKVPVDVKRTIEEYLEATERQSLEPSSPLFVQFRKGDRPQSEAVSDQLIRRVVEYYANKAGLTHKLTPHGLRATFVTLALEGGARLHQVQYAVGHSDPRTTERYHKRKLNLDDNASDYVKL